MSNRLPDPKAWGKLTSDEQGKTIEVMHWYGGAFVTALAEAWRRADSTNSDRLGTTFNELVVKYGPSSRFYNIFEKDSNGTDSDQHDIDPSGTGDPGA